MNKGTICVLGGTGFVGARLVTHLTDRGWHVRVPTRRRERHRALLVLPNVRLTEHAGLDEDTLVSLFQGCRAVVNLIGVLNGDEQTFRQVHAELPERVARACRRAGVGRYLHMSALNADAENGPSDYLKSKGEGERAVHALAGPDLRVTSFRPSVIFGPGDGFFNRFAGLLRLSPVLPLACPGARFAPVYLDDVCEAFITALEQPDRTADQHYDLCGPRTYTLRELVEYTARLADLKRKIVGLSDSLSERQARVFDGLFKYLPLDPPFSKDNYRSMQVDSVASPERPGLKDLGITPRSVESVMPGLFGIGPRSARYSLFRSLSRR